MQKYGIIQDGKLVVANEPADGYKPIRYTDIPDGFDQLTQFVIQTDPVDDGEVISVGVEINIIAPSDDAEMII